VIIDNPSIFEENISFWQMQRYRARGDHDDGNSHLSIEALKDAHDLFTRFGIKIACRFRRLREWKVG